MEEKNYTLLNGEQDAIIAPESEVFKCSIEEFECLWVKKEEFLKNGQKTFEDYDEAQEYYPDTVFYGYSDVKPEPKKGEFVCVYSNDGQGTGEDPYFWDYDTTCYKWWDGSNWQEFIGTYAEDLILIDEVIVSHTNTNYGRNEYYYLFKNDSSQSEYIIGYENDCNANPIEDIETFDSLDKAKEYLNNVKE